MTSEVLKFAHKYNKKYGEFVYSGENALEIALSGLEVKDKKVLVANNICHRVVLAIIRCGGIPVIAKPSNSIILTIEDIEEIQKRHKDLYAFIAVHQYGIYADIESVKNKFPKLKIIEDVAQSWNIRNIGKFSEYVISSFGKSKQLQLGIGGIVCSDTEEFKQYLDYDCKTSRHKENVLLPYILPDCVKVKFAKLSKIADRNIQKQFKSAKKLKKLVETRFSSLNMFNLEDGVWNRFPIWSNNSEDMAKFEQFLKQKNIKFERPHKIEMQDLEFVKGQKHYFENLTNNPIYLLLLKTRFYK